jgi:hypothetical protein
MELLDLGYEITEPIKTVNLGSNKVEWTDPPPPSPPLPEDAPMSQGA